VDNKVYIVKCRDYDQVEDKASELLNMMGGIEQFAAPGEEIVLKVNLLLAAEPERAVPTHPAVVTAIGKMVSQRGASATIVDSPGSGYQYTARTLERVYRICGMDAAAQAAGIGVNLDTTYRAVSFPDGELMKRRFAPR
jgi:uncharacterized protein (DUF362 family)